MRSGAKLLGYLMWLSSAYHTQPDPMHVRMLWVIAFLGTVAGSDLCTSQPSCESLIYCHGPLLHTVQMAHLYQDSKEFVDMRQKQHPNETFQLFQEFMNSTGGKPSKAQLEKFVEKAFEKGDELEYWSPPDWKENPRFLDDIKDPDLKKWGKDLNFLWKNLSRRVKEDVQHNQDHYSLIYVPNGFIIPGGRFREFYYWDTYWIIQGLLLSEMKTTVKGMLENFLTMVEKYGHIPNGGRVYYKMRSQPPLLIPMVKSYLEATGDMTFLKDNIKLLDKEFQFWMDNRMVQVTKDGRTYNLARYFAPSQGPRPESYSEDYEEAEFLHDEKSKYEFYCDIKSAAESGWDFSSRWFIKNGSNLGNLTDIHTRYIIPVDLNAFLYRNAELLCEFHNKMNNKGRAREYCEKAEEILKAVTAVLWNEEVGTWLDYDILNNKTRNYFYPSNLAPLWTGCYNKEYTDHYAQRSIDYIKNEQLLLFLGGIPTSLELSTQQWDLPNAWPPLQIIIIQGLHNTAVKKAIEEAEELAAIWIHSNYKGYLKEHQMFEKYDANTPGKNGGGGEYAVQAGFGWTNGVIMELLKMYGDKLTGYPGKRRDTSFKEHQWNMYYTGDHASS